MADPTKKPQPGRRRTRTFATPDGVAGRTSLPGLATGLPYRRGRAGLSIRSPSPHRSARATDRAPRPGRSAPQGPRSTTSRRTSRFQRALTWCMSNAAMPASRIAFTRPTSTAEARNPVRLVGRAPAELPTASSSAPTTRATFACRGSKRERGGGGVRARGGNGTTWPDDIRAPRRPPVRSIDGSVSRPPRPGVKFRGRRELPSPGLRRDRSGSCMAAVHAAT